MESNRLLPGALTPPSDAEESLNQDWFGLGRVTAGGRGRKGQAAPAPELMGSFYSET